MKHVSPLVMRFPEPPSWMMAEALRVLPPIEDPYDDYHPGIPNGPESRIKLYTVQNGEKVYYSGTPLPAWDGTELADAAPFVSRIPRTEK